MLITAKPTLSTSTASAAACTVSACGVSETRVRGIDPAGTAGTWGSTLPSLETHWASSCHCDEIVVGRLIVTNLRLPGQYDERLLSSLGLQGPYYNWNRWYLPGVGRYLEADPIALAGGFNGEFGPDWYGYANGNPLLFSDKTGEKPGYGNWCGPNWTGGKREEYSPWWKENYKPAENELDDACRRHDRCYYECRQKHPCSKCDRSKCFRQCDRLLTKFAYKTGGFWGYVIGAAIDRPGTRDPGSDDRFCRE